MTLLAHIGHWSIWLLYALPVFAVLIAIVIGSLRERRRRHEEGAGSRVSEHAEGGEEI